ncbi:MAG: ABC-2 family transporter protein [Acidobacteria bacterium]|nr:ABC-2 family transporter protein [Acidobacteriota bacterium]
MNAISQTVAPYLEFTRIGFVNILAFRLRYWTGIITYLINVTVYYFIWKAVYGPAAQAFGAGGTIAGYDLAQMITYVSVGWIIRSFYWNTIDQEMSYEVLEGKIAMELIKPVSVQWMWFSRALGESVFRLGMLTLPTAVVIVLLFPVRLPASAAHFALFIPVAFFPASVRAVMAWLPFQHIASSPLQIYLGKLSLGGAALALATQWAWVAALLWLADRWWRVSVKKITIHGG